MKNLLGTTGLQKADYYSPEPEKDYFFTGLIAIAVKKILLFLFSIFVLPVVLLKILTFILVPLKFIVGIKALALTNTALLALLFLKQVVTPITTLNPTSALQ
jgi:hypothetical protein